jgi:hypothetical protein
VGQLLPVKGPEWMGIGHYEQDISLPSKLGLFSSFSQGVRLMINCVMCKYKRDYVQVKNKPCVEHISIMHHLISWKCSCGSETVTFITACKNKMLKKLTREVQYLSQGETDLRVMFCKSMHENITRVLMRSI